MKTDEDLQKAVHDAIKWEPSLNTAEIGVTAKNGVVTLTGVVDAYSKKSKAELAAKNIAGVKVVVENIQIKLSSFGKKNDDEIAVEILNSFKLHESTQNQNLKVKIEGGWVTLDGELEWDCQKEAVTKSIINLDGVKEVTNNITIKAKTVNKINKKDIQQALDRNWSTNAQDILITISDNKVILSGTVHSIYQKEEAGRIAGKAPGVAGVENNLDVEYDVTNELAAIA